jgi:hypothetical protein
VRLAVAHARKLIPHFSRLLKGTCCLCLSSKFFQSKWLPI